MDSLNKAALKIKHAQYLSVFTGAGISKESGIPIFRGEDGVYNKYDPSLLEITTYKNNTAESWEAVKSVFYDTFKTASPNMAHNILYHWEKRGLLKYVITQNIDNLHREAGNKNVIEYHGNKEYFICLNCNEIYSTKDLQLTKEIPLCKKCGGLLKPDFVFFGEPIPSEAARLSQEVAQKSDVHIIIGTTGEVQPASYIPVYAKKAGATIIEINPEKSRFTDSITDIFIKKGASEALNQLNELITK
jgi:NAD-dependent deacetylase